MTREQMIEILTADRCTKAEAEKALKLCTTVFDDFEENFDKYMEEWRSSYSDNEDYEEAVKSYKKMIETGDPVEDWGVVKKDGKTYYIEYVL